MLANPFARGKIIQPLSRLLALSPPSAEPQKLAASAEPDLLAAAGGWRWRVSPAPWRKVTSLHLFMTRSILSYLSAFH